MESITTKPACGEAGALLFDNWFDPIKADLHAKVRDFIEALVEEELTTVLARPRYGRGPTAQDGTPASAVGRRHGRRPRQLTGTFGQPRWPCRVTGADGRTTAWKSQAP